MNFYLDIWIRFSMPNCIYLSIITPTYNREVELEVCYKSLLKQNSKSFEWIIVDDGSTDDTEQLVNSWIDEAKIKIRYFKQENQGRYIALNKGTKEANGYLSMFMDSDDWFVENSIDFIIDYWQSLDEKLQNELCGLSGLCLDKDEQIIGDKYPQEDYISSFFDIRTYDDVKGDKKEIIKLDILKRYLFPYYENQKRVPTTYVLYGMSKIYKSIFVNKPLIYKQYCDDGWSKNINKIRMNNAVSSREYYKYIVNLYYPFKLSKAFIYFANYFRYVFHSGVSLIEAIKNIKFSIMHPVSILVGYLYYRKDKR